MILHLVTDGRRLAVSDDPGKVGDALLTQARDAFAAGVDLVQVREPWMTARDLAPLVRRIVADSGGSRTRVVVNDRVDVAMASGAHGVHLKSTSVEPARVRRVVPRGFLIGLSVHSAAEAETAGDLVDYLVAGTVWPTSSKPKDQRLLGVDGLRDVVAAARVPVLAIGGVTVDRVQAVARTGAAGIAAISLFSPARATGLYPSHGARRLDDRVLEIRRLFDTPEPRS